MAEIFTLPLVYNRFECIPYETNIHRVLLSRFDIVDVFDENNKKIPLENLEDKIRNEVTELDNFDILRTFLVIDVESKELVCVFSIRNNTMHFQHKLSINKFNKIVPCIELVYIAVEKNYRNNHPETSGIGSAVFDSFIVPIVKFINKISGCKYLFLFAINQPKLIKYYKNKMDFLELDKKEEKCIVSSLKTDTNKGCKFLYQSIANM